MAYGGRFIDWLRSLTAKTSTLTGAEQIHIDSSGLSQKATLKDAVSYTAPDLAQTWNAAGTTFTGVKLNVTDTASAAVSLLMDLQVGGTSKFKVDKAGAFTSLGFFVDSTYCFIKGAAVPTTSDFTHVIGGSTVWGINENTTNIKWVNPTSYAVSLALYRDAANTLAQRNSTNAQESRVYATYTSTSNYQRCSIKTATASKTATAGATLTYTGLIPAGAFVIGVTSRVNTTCTTATGYTVGTSGDPDLWGVSAAVAAGTATGSANFTAVGASGLFTAATDVIVTATGGNFDGTGVIELAVHYLLTEAD